MAKSGAIRAGRAAVELGLDKTPFVRGLRSAEKDLKAFGAGVRNIGLAVFSAGASMVAPFVAAARTFNRMGDALDKAAIRTGVTVEALSGLAFAAEQSGSNIEELENALRFMSRVIAEASQGSQQAVDALSNLGLTADRLLRMTPEDQFKTIADAMSSIENPTVRAASALEVFGRSGTKMLPLVADGARGIEALQSQFDSFGATVTTADAKLAALLNDTWNEMAVTLRAFNMQVGAAVAPTFIDIANAARRSATTAIGWVRENRELVVVALKAAAAVAAIGGALVALGVSIQAAGFVVGGLATGIVAIGAAISAITSPLGLIASGAAIAGAALYRWTDIGGQAVKWLGEQIGELWKSISGLSDGILRLAISGQWSDAANLIASAFNAAFQSIAVKAKEVWHGIVTTVLDAVDAIAAAHEGVVDRVTRGFLRLSTAVDRFRKIAEAKAFHLAVVAGIKEQEISGADPRSIADARKTADEALAFKISQINADSDREIADLMRLATQEHEGVTGEIRRAADERYERTLAAIIADQEKLAATRDAYRKALESAQAIELGGGAFKPFSPTEFGFDDAGGALGEINKTKRTVFGTFSAVGASMLGGGGALEDMRDTMHKLFNEAKKTNELIRTHGSRSLTFS